MEEEAVKVKRRQEGKKGNKEVKSKGVVRIEGEEVNKRRKYRVGSFRKVRESEEEKEKGSSERIERVENMK